MKFAAAALAALAGVVPALAANITVIVGANDTLSFNPQVITAAVGDFVNFQFQGGNHTVTQSSFDSTSPHLQPAHVSFS
jgi:plastocyanin